MPPSNPHISTSVAHPVIWKYFFPKYTSKNLVSFNNLQRCIPNSGLNFMAIIIYHEFIVQWHGSRQHSLISTIITLEHFSKNSSYIQPPPPPQISSYDTNKSISCTTSTSLYIHSLVVRSVTSFHFYIDTLTHLTFLFLIDLILYTHIFYLDECQNLQCKCFQSYIITCATRHFFIYL